MTRHTGSYIGADHCVVSISLVSVIPTDMLWELTTDNLPAWIKLPILLALKFHLIQIRIHFLTTVVQAVFLHKNCGNFLALIFKYLV
jgi:hypothetical protein